MGARARFAALVLVAATPACTGALSANLPAPAAPVDVAGAERCRVAARQECPLVTEWAASEKADLEGRLASGQAVAVKYTGCELQIVDACRVPGKYAFRRTTLSSDTVEIHDADDLYAKLPVGAVALEGELERSGRLAVRTTIAGEYRLEGPAPSLAQVPGCADATHVVGAVSVGAFSLVAGGAVAGRASVDAKIAAAGGGLRREEVTVRQAGDDRACRDATDAAPSPMCGSPVQIFLSRLPGDAQAPSDDARIAALADRRARASGVLIDIPAPRDPLERWALHDADGRPLCDLPCSRWIPPRSGYYLERSPTDLRDGLRIDVPNDLPPAGSHLQAEYGPERGAPFLSKLTFYGAGIPMGALALGLGIAAAADPHGDFAGFFAGDAVFFALFAGASTWWFLYSDEKHLRLQPAASDGTPRPGPVGAAPTLTVTPNGLVGTF